MILYIENPKEATKKLLELINMNLVKLKFSNSVGYKINTQKHLAFLYTVNIISEREIRKTIPFTTATGRIKCL